VNQESELESVAPATDGAAVEAAATAPEEAPAEAGEIAALKAPVTELKNEVLRARADVENQRKRAERDVEAAHKYGLERLVQALLPVRDSMELGLTAALTATEVSALQQGMELTMKQLVDLFEKLNIRKLEPTGERFDPEFHQGMTMQADPDAAPGTVLRVLQAGYVLNERLLRPALVVVAADARG